MNDTEENPKQKLFKVGEYNQKFNDLLSCTLPVVDIMQSVGLEVHIRNRHPNCVNYIGKIGEIIEAPDYVGINKKEPSSIELVKKYDDHILIAIKLDKDSNGLYVASLYEVKDSKISKRLHSGRLKRFS
ncbi:MAG: hypothetical protein AB9856_07470 [Cellulosilyticaceae bacterium]